MKEGIKGGREERREGRKERKKKVREGGKEEGRKRHVVKIERMGNKRKLKSKRLPLKSSVRIRQ